MIAPEIIDHILSFLKSESDYSTLETCSNVFPQLVDRHLYSRICLRTPMFDVDDTEPDDDEVQFYTPPCLDFIDKITQRPCILLSVIHVRVMIITLPAPLNDRTLELLPMITLFLPIFLKLQSIDLRAMGTSPWTTLGPDFAAAVQKCLRSPLINQASISNIDGFPLDLFDDCKNLKKLSLNGRFTGSSTTSSGPPLSSLRIEVEGSEPAFHLPKIVSWMNSRTLQSLSLRVYQSTLDLQPLIEACSPTLLTLELDTAIDIKLDHPTGGTTFPVLKSLTLHSVITSPTEFTFSFNPNFASFLTAFSRNSSPDSVHLSVLLRFVTLPLVDRYESSDIKWPSITFLDGLPVFRRPIQFHLVKPRFAMIRFGYLFELSSDVKRLLEDGRITIDDPFE